ncbi:MAG: hypothetical protein QOF01_4303 [Thermomicrobiales bacterium]|nr:hypothetical protein [Thermomicrobiales bacterium]
MPTTNRSHAKNDCPLRDSISTPNSAWGIAWEQRDLLAETGVSRRCAECFSGPEPGSTGCQRFVPFDVGGDGLEIGWPDIETGLRPHLEFGGKRQRTVVGWGPGDGVRPPGEPAAV